MLEGVGNGFNAVTRTVSLRQGRWGCHVHEKEPHGSFRNKNTYLKKMQCTVLIVGWKQQRRVCELEDRSTNLSNLKKKGGKKRASGFQRTIQRDLHELGNQSPRE